MSILLDSGKCTIEQINKLNKDLDITVTIKKFGKSGKMTGIPIQHNLQPFRTQNNLVFIPYSYGVSEGYKSMFHSKLSNPIEFIGSLRDEQKIVRNEALEQLNKKGSIIISTHVGFGKSILATYFAYKIQMKTLIVVNRLVLINQWKDVLKSFIKNPKTYVLKPGEIIDWSCDFFIVNAINMPKFGYMPEIGLVIVDEVHLIVSKILSECFQYVTPTYLIGLSATPYRTDGLDILLDIYFGKERIDRQLNREHIVYKIDTKFKPKMNKLTSGKIDWNDILNQQALDENRNDLICSIVQKNIEKNFLILCKRVEQIKILEKKFLDKNIQVESLYGDKQPSIEPKKVVIGTIQKVGTGFDAPYLNTLIVASDLEAYFIQYLGRIFRKRDHIPVVYDLVDNDFLLKKHWSTREETYIKHGGIIKPFGL
jgi:superfamily II DNA or RNA helicase